jgi:hypothetical protein
MEYILIMLGVPVGSAWSLAKPGKSCGGVYQRVQYAMANKYLEEQGLMSPIIIYNNVDLFLS